MPKWVRWISINTGPNANGILSQETNQTFHAVCMEICRGRLSSDAADRLKFDSARPLTQTESFAFHLQFCLLTSNPNVSPMKLCDFTVSSDYVTNCEISLEVMSTGLPSPVHKHAHQVDNKNVSVCEWRVSCGGLVTCPGCVPASRSVTAGLQQPPWPWLGIGNNRKWMDLIFCTDPPKIPSVSQSNTLF